jgi:hypothetical protein
MQSVCGAEVMQYFRSSIRLELTQSMDVTLCLGSLVVTSSSALARQKSVISRQKMEDLSNVRPSSINTIQYDTMVPLYHKP